MKQWLSDFKQFAIKGNAIDMAIGIVIGAAFGKIVSIQLFSHINRGKTDYALLPKATRDYLFAVVPIGIKQIWLEKKK